MTIGEALLITDDKFVLFLPECTENTRESLTARLTNGTKISGETDTEIVGQN